MLTCCCCLVVVVAAERSVGWQWIACVLVGSFEAMRLMVAGGGGV